MAESKILQRFFEEQHRNLKKRAYTSLQCLCGRHPVHSDHGEWLKRQVEKNLDTSPSPTNTAHPKTHPRD